MQQGPPEEPEEFVVSSVSLIDVQRMSLPFAEHSPSPAVHAGTPETVSSLVFHWQLRSFSDSHRESSFSHLMTC